MDETQLKEIINAVDKMTFMYGYPVSSGYRGLVNGVWMLFPTDTEYHEYVNELN